MYRFVKKKIFRFLADRKLRKRSEDFIKYFTPVLSNTAAVDDQSYSMRHQVYCVEEEFEPQAWDNREFDEYDKFSISIMLHHNPSSLFVATTRLVIPLDGSQKMPVEEHMLHTLFPGALSPEDISVHNKAEISRFAVPKKYRRKNVDFLNVNELLYLDELTEEDKDCFEMIALCQMLCIVAISQLIGRERLFAVMEPRLARHLRIIGFEFDQIGKVGNFHGRRALFTGDATESMVNLLPSLKQLYETMYKALSVQIHNHPMVKSGQLKVEQSATFGSALK